MVEGWSKKTNERERTQGHGQECGACGRRERQRGGGGRGHRGNAWRCSCEVLKLMLFVVGGGGGGCVGGCGCVAKLIQCFRDRVYIKISRELLSGLFNPSRQMGAWWAE